MTASTKPTNGPRIHYLELREAPDGYREVRQTPPKLRLKMYGQRGQAGVSIEPVGQGTGTVASPPARGILVTGSVSPGKKSVSFDAMVMEKTFIRHSPDVEHVLATLESAPQARPDNDFLTAEQGEEALAALLDLAERTAFNSLGVTKRSGLSRAVEVLRNGLKGLRASSSSKRFSRHFDALLRSHEGILDGKAAVCISLFGAALTSMRAARQGMSTYDMEKAFSDALDVGGQRGYVERQLGRMLRDFAQNPGALDPAEQAKAVSDIWHGWVRGCRDEGVRGHFLRQWWMHSSVLEGGGELADAITQLCQADQFDPEQVKQGLLDILDMPHLTREEKEHRTALLMDFCDVGQPLEELKATVNSLRFDEGPDFDHTLEKMASAIAVHEFRREPSALQVREDIRRLKEQVQQLPVAHATPDERSKLLIPLFADFCKTVADVLDKAPPEFRRQLAMIYFGALDGFDKAIDLGSPKEFLKCLGELKTKLDQGTFRKAFSGKDILGALEGVLDRFCDEGSDKELAGMIVAWLAVDVSDELEAAFQTLWPVVNTSGEAEALQGLATVIRDLQYPS